MRHDIEITVILKSGRNYKGYYHNETVNISLTKITDRLNKNTTKTARKYLTEGGYYPRFRVELDPSSRFRIQFGGYTLIDDYNFDDKCLHYSRFNGTPEMFQKHIEDDIYGRCVDAVEILNKGLTTLLKSKKFTR